MHEKPKYNPQIHHRRSIRLRGYDYSQAGLYFITICCEDRECRFGKIENDEMILNEYGTIAYNEWIKLTERFSNLERDVFQIMPNHMHGIIALHDIVWAGFTPAQNIPMDKPIRAGFPPAQNTPMDKPVRAGFPPAQNDDEITGQPQTGQFQNGQPRGLPLPISGVDNGAGFTPAPTKPATIGDIVGAYKSLVANECLKIWKLKWAGVNPAPHMGKLWQRNYYEHIIRNEQSYQTISEYIINNPVKWKGDKFFK